jgi:hypothetical protein
MSINNFKHATITQEKKGKVLLRRYKSYIPRTGGCFLMLTAAWKRFK